MLIWLSLAVSERFSAKLRFAEVEGGEWRSPFWPCFPVLGLDLPLVKVFSLFPAIFFRERENFCRFFKKLLDRHWKV